jgi:phage-related protein
MSMQKNLIHVRFFQTATGQQPVRFWLRSLPKEQRQAIGEAIGEVQIGWPVGMPLVRKLERALWEIRKNIPPNEIARVIFSIAETPQAIILLHGFIKKSQKTPQRELNTARKRLKEGQI